METQKLSIKKCKSCGKNYNPRFLNEFQNMREKHAGLLVNATSDSERDDIIKSCEDERTEFFNKYLPKYCCRIQPLTVIPQYQIHIPP